MKRTITALVALALSVGSLAGCGQGETPGVVEGEVQVVETPSEHPEHRPLIEGSVNFTEGDDAGLLEIAMDDTSQSVVVEDGGLTWELVVPAEALVQPTKLRIVPMTNISSELGEIAGGVVLKPDGQRFVVPVTLRVSGVGADVGAIFSGNHQADELALANVQRHGGVVEAQLSHFSTAFFTDSEALLETLRTTAVTQRAEAEKLAKELSRKPIEVPVPPAIPNRCPAETSAENGAVIADYIQKFGHPEHDVLEALLAANRNVVLTSDESPSFDWERGIALRLHRKAETLIKQYKGDDDRFDAVAAATLHAERGAGLLGEPLGDRSLLPALAGWAERLAIKHLDAVAKDHELAEFVPAFTRVRQAGLLGAAGYDQLNQRLWGVLTFTIGFKGTVTQKRDSTASWGTSGEGEAAFEGVNEGYLILMGNTIGTHDSYSSTDPAAAPTLVTKEFETDLYLILDPPCYATGRVGLTRLGAKELTYDSDIGPITVPSHYNLINQLALGEYYDAGVGAVLVEVDLAGLGGVVEVPLTGTHEYTTVDYALTLRHTPR